MTYFYRKPEYISSLSRKLRREQTRAEVLLWQKLKNKQINGFRFLRQKPIFAFKENNGSERFYIADFYCHSKRLIIEIDGLIHNEKDRIEYDEIRDEILKNNNYTILRFTNDEIEININFVIEKIKYLAINKCLNFPSLI